MKKRTEGEPVRVVRSDMNRTDSVYQVPSDHAFKDLPGRLILVTPNNGYPQFTKAFLAKEQQLADLDNELRRTTGRGGTLKDLFEMLAEKRATTQ